ncbi:MAG: HlyD family secretion protein [Coxiellaceae bacterium]|nr:HlyD family secretion protein [Coxiellaceae bacterium]
MTKPVQNQQTTEEVAIKPPRPLRFWVCWVIAVLVLLAIAIIIFDNITPNTDDAYLYANVVQISPQVSGRVVRVFVLKDEKVKKGEKLFQLDARPYQHRVDALKAAYVKQVYAVKLLHQSVKQAQDNVESLMAQVELAQIRYQDFKQLAIDGAVSQLTAITASDQLKKLQADLQLSKVEYAKTITRIDALINDKNVLSQQALATLEKAEFDLHQTLVTAPADGYVTNVTLLPGMYTDAGTAALTFVNTDRWWVIANLKENNMHGVRLGQTAKFSVSMYPGRMYEGKVARLPEGVNVHKIVPPVYLPYVAKTPNWIRLAQRFPVWIHVDVSQFKGRPPRIGTTTAVVVFRPDHRIINALAYALLVVKSYLYYLY